MSSAIPSTTKQIAKKIADDKGVDVQLVVEILDAHTEAVKRCLENEMPCMLTGLGKFYISYRKGGSFNILDCDTREFLKNKVHKQVCFQVVRSAKARLQGWVHDLGLKNNIDRSEMMSLAIKPEEIIKTRRKKILEDQRAYGFTPDLLFDEEDLCEADRAVMRQEGDAPSIKEVLDKIGIFEEK